MRSDYTLISFISFIIIVFIISYNQIKPEIDKKCGYRNNKNIILVEDYDKCFERKRERKIIVQELKRIMIVAHPDDETIFGGGHLLEEHYTVVCVTCGVVDYRVKEFENIMNITQDDYIMLGFTDRVNKTGTISNWYNEYNKIYEALNNILTSVDWDVIVTHNPEGEYGHIHHKKVNEIVTKIVDKNKLYYFGKWYKKNIPGNKIKKQIYEKKINQLIPIYENSQKNALNYNRQMLPYENWIKANEW